MDGQSLGTQPAPLKITIIGGGFSGSLLATHLLAPDLWPSGSAPLEITLIERGPRLGRGIAYATDDPAHLLNVRAGGMSAFPDDPGHFVRWLAEHSPQVPVSPTDFVSRGRFGDYVADLLQQAQQAVPPDRRLTVVTGEVADLVPGTEGMGLELTDGRRLVSDLVVLATGNRLPGRPAAISPAAAASVDYLANPWDGDRLRRLPADQPVLILGTGLTMVDSVISLAGQGHRGPILALSRRGRLPIAHAETRPFVLSEAPTTLPPKISVLMRFLRAEAARAERQGAGWRSAFDALRPDHQKLWQALSVAERQRFLRHVRPWWDIHRHRLPPAVADDFARLRADGRVRVTAGRLTGLEPDAAGRLTADYVTRDQAGVQQCQGVAVINATGPCADQGGDQLTTALIDRGLIQPDHLGLGVQVAADGAVLDPSGTVASRLFALGPLTRGGVWEMTAVPELRRACADLAHCLRAKAAALALSTRREPPRDL